MRSKKLINYSFFKKIFRDYKWSLLLYSLIVLLYGILIVGIFPTVQKETAGLEKLLEAYPPVLKEAFGISTSSLNTIEGFLSVEYFSFVWVGIIGILIFSLGASIVSGEIDKGTSEFSFTLPLPRHKIVLSKFIASYFLSLIVISITLISVIIGIYIIGETPYFKGLLAFFMTALALSFFLLALTFFLSSIFDNKGKVYGACGGFFVLSYLIHILAGISDKVSDFYFLSFFKYYGSPETILTSGNIEIKNIFVFSLTGLIFLILGLIISEKRDL